MNGGHWGLGNRGVTNHRASLKTEARSSSYALRVYGTVRLSRVAATLLVAVLVSGLTLAGAARRRRQRICVTVTGGVAAGNHS